MRSDAYILEKRDRDRSPRHKKRRSNEKKDRQEVIGQGGPFLGQDEERPLEARDQGLSQVKELKRLDVAGSATEKSKKDFFVQWHLTSRCNLACAHCYQEGGHGPELDFAAIRRLAGEVSDMVGDWAEDYDIPFSPSFNVTGGEPLLLGDIVEVLRLLKGEGFQVYLLTNGTLVDEERAKRLSGLVDGVQISIEGPEGLHDSIRGKGAFLEAMKGTLRLVGQDIPVAFNMTLSTLNVDSLDEVVSIALDAGVRRVGFSRLVPYGRGKGLAGKMLSPGKVRETYGRLLEFRDDRIQITTGDPIAASLEGPKADGGDFPFGGCAAAVSGLTILPDATLLPCRRLPVPIGNTRTASIRRIWTQSPVLNMLRDRKAYVGRCGRCSRWADCRGCRAVAYACSRLSGKADFLADDPQCFLQTGSGRTATDIQPAGLERWKGTC